MAMIIELSAQVPTVYAGKPREVWLRLRVPKAFQGKAVLSRLGGSAGYEPVVETEREPVVWDSNDEIGAEGPAGAVCYLYRLPWVDQTLLVFGGYTLDPSVFPLIYVVDVDLDAALDDMRPMVKIATPAALGLNYIPIAYESNRFGKALKHALHELCRLGVELDGHVVDHTERRGDDAPRGLRADP